MVSILRQAGVFADRVDERYPDIAQIVAKKEGQCIVTLKDVLLTCHGILYYAMITSYAALPRKTEVQDACIR